jgi:tetratricopeptide (TPR) repeat protein
MNNSKMIQWSGLMIGCLLLFAGCGAREVNLPENGQVASVPEVITVERENTAPIISRPVITPEPETQIQIPPTKISDDEPIGKKYVRPDDPHLQLIAERLAFYRGMNVDPGSVIDSGFSKGNFYFISREWQQCRSRYDSIVEKYSRLVNTSSAPIKLKESDLARLYREDFQFYSEGCDEVLSDGVDLPHGRLGGVVEEQIGADLNRQVASQQYEKALVTFEKLKQISVKQRQSVEALDSYAQALLRSGRVEEAAAVYRQMVELVSEEDSDIKPWTIQRRLADLLLVSGQQQASRQQYEQLISSFADFAAENNKALSQLAFLENGSISKREFNSYLNILKGSLTYGDIPAALRLLRAAEDFQRRYPFSPVIKGVVAVREKTEKQLRVWTGAELQKVDELIEQKDFDQARSIISRLMPDDQPFVVQEIISKTLDDVVVAEAREQERVRAAQERELEHQWTSATYLLDTRQYDDAIKGYELLLGTSREAKARFKIQESMNAAANDNRKEAANLFIRAARTKDPEKKVELLLASRQLLKKILVRYPQADLVDKVSRNLSVLESRLRKIDPALLEPDES